VEGKDVQEDILDELEIYFAPRLTRITAMRGSYGYVSPERKKVSDIISPHNARNLKFSDTQKLEIEELGQNEARG